MKIFNRKAKHEYMILQSLEAGVVLSGAEVKSVRSGRVDLSESFGRIVNGEVILKNLYLYPHISTDSSADPRRDRKLLLHKTQIAQLEAKIRGQALTLVPLSLYTAHNLIKVELALAASKRKYDKKRALKMRDEQRKIEQELKDVKFEF